MCIYCAQLLYKQFDGAAIISSKTADFGFCPATLLFLQVTTVGHV